MKDISTFGKGLIACNDGGQCKKGKCNGDACGIGNKPQSRKREDGGQAPIVEETESCITELPAIIFNCKYFPDCTQDHRDGSKRHWKGICTNTMNHLRNEACASMLKLRLEIISLETSLLRSDGHTCYSQTPQFEYLKLVLRS